MKNAQEFYDAFLPLCEKVNESLKQPLPNDYIQGYCQQRAQSASRRSLKTYRYDFEKGVAASQLENFHRQEDARKFGNKEARKLKARIEKREKREAAKEQKKALKAEREKEVKPSERVRSFIKDALKKDESE